MNWEKIVEQFKKPKGPTRNEKLVKVIQTYKKTKDPLMLDLRTHLGQPYKWDDQSLNTAYEYIVDCEQNGIAKPVPVKAAVSPAKDNRLIVKSNFAYGKEYSAGQIKKAAAFCEIYNSIQNDAVS